MQYGKQVRLWQGAQGAPVSFLPNIGAQCRNTVSPLHSSVGLRRRGERKRRNADALWLYRSFLNRAYPTMKKHNPHLPILMREAEGTLPRVYARYGRTWTRSDTGRKIKWLIGFCLLDLGREKQEVLLGEWPPSPVSPAQFMANEIVMYRSFG